MSDELELAFQYWKTAAEMRLEFIERLGQFKLDSARSDLVHAAAAGQWALARMKARVALELDASLGRLRRMRTQTANRIRRLERHARTAAKIRNAEEIPPNERARMWAAITILERLAPAVVIQKLIATKLSPSARRGEHFVDPGRPQQRVQDVPVTVDNVHGLIAWLKNNRLVPRRGSEPYGLLMAACSDVSAIAQTQIEQMRSALKELEQGTFNIWQPLVIAGLPETVDIKKIVRTGI